MYEYSAVMATPGAEMHTPSQELSTRSKLSCLSWNKYLRTYLASSDYEGVVHIWDVATGQNVVEYEAHEKRIWSVDFCQSDPTLLMSGSDDGMVKVGLLCLSQSLCTIPFELVPSSFAVGWLTCLHSAGWTLCHAVILHAHSGLKFAAKLRAGGHMPVAVFCNNACVLLVCM